MNPSDSTVTTALQPPEDYRGSWASRHAALAAVGIVVLAAALRLGVAPFITMYGDEAHTVAVARFSFAELLRCEAFDIGNPQGYHLFLAAWRQAFGENILAYRLLNAIIGTAAVAMIMVLCRAMVPRTGIWLAVGLLTALNPMHLVFSLQIRPWAIQMLTLSAATWAVLRWRRTRRGGWLGLYVLGMFVAVNTNYSALFFWVTIGLWWLWDARRSGRQLAAVVITNAILLAALVPTSIFLWWQVHHQEMIRGGGGWMFHLFGFPYFFIYGNSVARPERGLALMAATAVPALVVLVPAMLLGLREVWKAARPRGLVLMMLFLPFFMLAGLCLFTPFFFSRYLAFIWPMFALTAVLGLAAMGRRLYVAGMGLLLAMQLVGCAGYAARYAVDYPPYLRQTLQAEADDDYGVLVYPLGARQLAIELSGQPMLMRVDQLTPEVRVTTFPARPMDFVKTYPYPQQALSEVLAGELPAEMWLYCDQRFGNYFPDGPAVQQRVTEMLTKRYRLDGEWHWPGAAEGNIHLFRFRRVEGPASRGTTAS